MLGKPKLTSLAFVALNINSALENGHGHSVSFDDIYESLERGTLLEDLSNKLPGEFDFSLFPPNSEQCVTLNYVLNEVASCLRGREPRKVGIEDSGLHLLMAIILKAMQNKYWTIPNAGYDSDSFFFGPQ